MFSKYWNSLRVLLARPVDGGSLAVARMVVGLVVLLTALDMVLSDGGSTQLRELYTAEHIHWHPTFAGFQWVPVFDEPVMIAICWLMAASGLLVMVGCFFRPAVIVATLLRTYVMLADATYYNNHYYLECLLLGLLCCMPAARRYSVDAWRRGRLGNTVEPKIPFWPVFLLRGQLLFVYFFGGLTKLNEFYLLHAFPLRSALLNPNLAGRLSWLLSADQLEGLRTWMARTEVAFAFAYAGVLFDLSVGFLLLFRPTRWLGIALTVVFHLLNHFVLFYDIRWFPLMGIGTVTIFLDPDWPARAWARMRGNVKSAKAKSPAGRSGKWKPVSAATAGLICAWLLVQAIVPLRHWVIAGDVSWTEEGAWFSWRMKAHHKLTRPTVFRVEDDRLLRRAEDGSTEIVWEEWPGEKWMIQDIDFTRVDWRQLPQIFVEFVPFYGERILFNPYAGRREPLNVDQSVQRMQEFWRQHYHRTLDVSRMHATETLVKVMEFWQGHLEQDGASPELIAAAQRCRAQAASIEQLRHNPIAWELAVDQLHKLIVPLVRDPKRDGQFRNLLSRLSPFALAGVEAPGVRFFYIEDPALQAPNESRYMAIQRDAWVEAFPEAHYVYADTNLFTNWEWFALPRVLAVRTVDGAEQIRWNPHKELNEYQEQFMRPHPAILHEYAQHIADEWESERGRRPRVYVDSAVSLLPWPMQPLIDPEVDLAAAPRHVMRHNDWILPLKKDPAALRKSREDATSDDTSSSSAER